MTHFKIVINCGPCQEFIGQCISSVQAQSHKSWEAYVTVDAPGDLTYERALAAAKGDRRIHIHLNLARRHSMYNHIQAIARSGAAHEDVIASLDGDDWLADNDALRMIADLYDTHDCWVTYGSWLSNVTGLNGLRNGQYPAYPEGEADFRHTRFLGTALRTWKKWLWDHLKDADLRSDTGEYVRVSEDQVIMIPLLEMAGTARAKHIAAPIMTYNRLVNYVRDESITQEGVRNGELIERRPPYPRLANKIYVGVTANAAV